MEDNCNQMLPNFDLLKRMFGKTSKTSDDLIINISSDDFKNLVKFIISNFHFDESFYIRTYPDVADAVRSGLISSAYDHYVTSGYFEGRFGSLKGFDPETYCDINEDVRAGANGHDIAQFAVDHFVNHGYREGRSYTSKSPSD